MENEDIKNKAFAGDELGAITHSLQCTKCKRKSFIATRSSVCGVKSKSGDSCNGRFQKQQ